MMFQGDVLGEGSNNFSPSQAGEFCLDHTQRMTVQFEFSDMSSALAQESPSLRQEWPFFFPIFVVKRCVGYGMVVG